MYRIRSELFGLASPSLSGSSSSNSLMLFLSTCPHGMHTCMRRGSQAEEDHWEDVSTRSSLIVKS